MKKVYSLASIAALLLVLQCLNSCTNAGYYLQAAKGQMAILSSRQDIDDIIDDHNQPDALKQQLALILRLRDFAESALQLPTNNHYTTYVETHRPYVVWNVFAAAEFSTKPEQWCFPIAGCISYRGYFEEQSALDYAKSLTEDGLETYVNGVTAYSTLGWFDDPVLNTFVSYPEESLSALIFHELAHQQLYIKGDSVFNESFATAIEREGLKRWLKHADKEQLLTRYQLKKSRQQQFLNLVLSHQSERTKLYASALTDQQKRNNKALLIKEIRGDYRVIKAQWGGYNGYDAWFNGPLNNAQLSTVATYNTLVSGFEHLLATFHYDLNLFYKYCKTLENLSVEQRHQNIVNPQS